MFAKFAACDVALKKLLVPQAFSQPHKKPHISSKSLQAANPIAIAVQISLSNRHFLQTT